MASSNANFKSQDEFRRQKELEEARKAGLAEPEKDEEGKEINPHIPQYMTNAPWYLNSDKPSLKHQRNWNKKDTAGATWYDRGQKVFQAKKYRKGACINCGAMTHASKDCLERPRKVGAKWTNKFIAADEKVETIAMDSWDGKRDRWNGYDERDHARVVERFEVLEKARQEQRRQEEMQRRYTTEDEKRAEGEVDTQLDDEDKIDDTQDAGFSEVKKRVRTTAGGSTGTVRNLRIREDTAKYLYNLDVNSAHYDPKSRSMREDPNPGKPLGDDKPFAGDNFVRKTGDYSAWQSLTVHQIQANDRGHELHVQAAPSQAEALFQQFKQKKDKLQVSSKKGVLDKYGNAASTDRPEQEELFGQTERYEEYDRTGRLIKGKEEKVRSRYEEDVYINNHTSVWGSFWKDGQWGYTCCHQTDKNSYCTGQRGKEAASRQEQVMMSNLEHLAATQGSEAVEQEKLRRAEASKLNGYKGPHEELWGSEAAAAAV